MICIDTKSSDIYYNLAAEYYFAAEKTITGRESDDIFMLWNTTPTIIIGRFQNLIEEVDLTYIREKNITVARRLSGGGTIYSDENNLMFTFIAHGMGIEINFERFVRPIIDSLKLLGAEAELSGRNDIMIGKRKISGNAQYRAGGNVIHHGTLLLESNLEELLRATTPKDYKIVSKAIKSVRERVTNLNDHLPSRLSPDEVKAHLAKTIADSFYEITPVDDRRIRELAKEKFDDEKIIFSAVPKFEIEKTVLTNGGGYEFSLSVISGVIENASVAGDFFANFTAEDLVSALTGCEYTPTAVEKSLQKLSEGFFRTDAHELTLGIFE